MVLTCDACTEPIDGTALLVPKFPKGAYHFHAKPACQRTAIRRAAVAFPNISGKRGTRVTSRPVP